MHRSSQKCVKQDMCLHHLVFEECGGISGCSCSFCNNSIRPYPIIPFDILTKFVIQINLFEQDTALVKAYLGQNLNNAWHNFVEQLGLGGI